MTTLQVTYFAFIFAFAFATAYLLIWLVLMSPLVNAFTDRPDVRKVHQRLVPRAGGVCIVVTVLGIHAMWNLLGGIVLPPLPTRVFYTIMAAGLSLGLVGILDDTIYFDLSALAKLVVQIAVAAVLILGSGIRFETVYLFDTTTISLGHLAFPLSLLWLVGVTNAINIIDGLDGLAGTVSLISFVTIAVFAGMVHDYQLLMVTLAFAGALLAFLLHNAPPARMFLGDTGSMFIGMTLGFLTMYLAGKGEACPVVVGPLIVAFPVLDVAVAMGRRFVSTMSASNPWYRALTAMLVPDNEHIHHRFLQRGLHHSWVVATIAMLHLTACSAAILIPFLPLPWVLACLLYLCSMALWYLYQLDFFSRLARNYRVRREFDVWRKMQNRELIGVVQSDSVLQHALVNYRQDFFSFEFLSVGRASQEHGKVQRWSAIILENHYDNKLADDIESACTISRIAECPVFILSDSAGLIGWETAHYKDCVITFVNKPIYVPVVLKKLAESVEQFRDDRPAEKAAEGMQTASREPEFVLRGSS